jgi:DNA polymerase alpha subunit A
MRYEYGEKAIYSQLVYFASLWDVERARTAAAAEGGDLSAEDREKIAVLAEHNRVRFGTVKAAVDKYLDKCGRQWVAMDTLFAKLGFNKLAA